MSREETKGNTNGRKKARALLQAFGLMELENYFRLLFEDERAHLLDQEGR